MNATEHEPPCGQRELKELQELQDLHETHELPPHSLGGRDLLPLLSRGGLLLPSGDLLELKLRLMR